MKELEELFQHEVLVCVGTGGVGKTTSAAALGVKAAQAGKRVLVLTIDPAQRLATSLGLSEEARAKGEIVEVPPSEFAQPPKGQLFASVIQAQKIFDDFICSEAPADQAERLMKNRLYQQLTTRLAGSQEFTSLEKLLQCHEDQRFDLIVLDTPPAQHSLDFLGAPLKLHALFQSSVTQWFLNSKGDKEQGWLKRTLSGGKDRAFSILKQLTGSDFIRELQEFFELAQAWQKKLGQRMVDVHRLLTSEKTAFVLVTSFDEAKLDEAFVFHKELKRQGYQLSCLCINRAYPSWLNINVDIEVTESSSQAVQTLRSMYRRWQSHFRRRRERVFKEKKKMNPETLTLLIPEFTSDIYNLQGIERIAESVLREEDL